MMPHYRGMSRGLCRVVRSCGYGMGHYALQLRFKLAPDAEESLLQWFGGELNAGTLPAARARQRSSAARRADRDDDIRTAYPWRRRRGRLGLAGDRLWWTRLTICGTTISSGAALERRGATETAATSYRSAYTLTRQEITSG